MVKRKTKVKVDLQSPEYRIQEQKAMIKLKKIEVEAIAMEHAGMVAELQRMLVRRAMDINGIKRVEI